MIKSPENMNSRALFYCLNSVHDTTEFQTISKATPSAVHLSPRFYVSTSKSIIKALINMHSFEIQLSPIG
ncbi:hypothetical protein A3124_13000 [Salmonella enterica subsp. enterica serovar Typhimurium]|nr:hypothetical protein [Salmonella enterica subsp. enterica serovar Typhimurium]